MRQELIQKIITQAQQGDFGMIEQLVKLSHDTILQRVAPDMGTYIGKPLFILRRQMEDKVLELTTPDYMLARAMFGNSKSIKAKSATLYMSTIQGGKDPNWLYDPEDLEELQKETFSTDGAKRFKSKVVLEVEGLATADATEEEIRELVTKGVTPVFVLSNIIESSTTIQDMSLDI